MAKLLGVSVLMAAGVLSAGGVQSALRVGDTSVTTLVSVATLAFAVFAAGSVTKPFRMNYAWSGAPWLRAQGQSGPWPRAAMIAGAGRMLRR
jgi:hypothetical protein